MTDDKLKAETAYLFSRNWEDDLTEEQEDEYTDRANALIATYGWPKVFEAWNNYLHTECGTPEAVANFANLYWRYGGQDYPITDPHKFLAYMLYKMNCRMWDYDNGYVIESIAITILPREGYPEADLYLNPYYALDQDPKILAEVEKYWQQNA